MSTQFQLQRQPGASAEAAPVAVPQVQRRCALGNQAVSGGESQQCSRRLRQRIQARLRVNEPNDLHEREAHRIADRVLAGPTHTNIAGTPPRISRSGSRSAGQNIILPASVHQVLKGSGRPLQPRLKQDMESRFGYDFSLVRVHTDSAADRSARDLNAEAYTLGRNVVFGAGRFMPGSLDGRRLLAHELTHVIQQRGNDPNGAGRYYGYSIGSPGPLVQRRLVVSPTASIPLPPGMSGPPEPLTLAVQGLLRDTCPSGGATVNAATGGVALGASLCDWPGPPYRTDIRHADISPTPAGCGCLCDVVGNAQTTTVDFLAGGPATDVPPGGAGFGGRPASTTVRIDPRFQGQYRISGRWVNVPFHLLFAHEICGHALPLMRGTHVRPGPAPAGGTPPHERRAVDVEREIAAEGSHPRRPEDYAGAARQRP